MLGIKENRLIVILMILVALGLGIFVGIIYADNSDVVATVDGEKISKDDLYESLVSQSGGQALDMLITEKIIDLEALKKNIAISEDDIAQELEKAKSYYGGDDAFNQALAAAGLSLDSIRGDLESNIKVRKLLEPYITITDEEMQAFFEENKELFNVAEQVKASHILVNTQEEAAEIKDKLALGEDFARLAKEYSVDYTNNEQGGELGFIKRGEMVQEFEDATFALAAGEISDPVETEYGYHIIKVAEKVAAQEAVYDESKEEVKEKIFDEKMQTEYYNWLNERYAEYTIENHLAG
ncbi:MAG: peptidylprolyl isomerase [Peptococcaceae bacterium]